MTQVRFLFFLAATATSCTAIANQDPCIAHEIASAAQIANSAVDATLVAEIGGDGDGQPDGQPNEDGDGFFDTSCVDRMSDLVHGFSIASTMDAAVSQGIRQARQAVCTGLDMALDATVGQLEDSVSYDYGYGTIGVGYDNSRNYNGDGPAWGGWNVQDDWTGEEYETEDWNPFAPLND